MSKYRNKKVEYDGITFDSVKEYNRWCELVSLQIFGQIENLKRQVRYELIPTQYAEVGGKRKAVERSVYYVADFVYTKNGNQVVEDVKGYRDPRSAAYAKYIIKRKLMRWIYGVEIKEI